MKVSAWLRLLIVWGGRLSVEVTQPVELRKNSIFWCFSSCIQWDMNPFIARKYFLFPMKNPRFGADNSHRISTVSPLSPHSGHRFFDSEMAWFCSTFWALFSDIWFSVKQETMVVFLWTTNGYIVVTFIEHLQYCPSHHITVITFFTEKYYHFVEFFSEKNEIFCDV